MTEHSGLLDVIVTHRATEADGIISLALGPATAQALPAAMPGAHVDVHLPSGRVRQYSLYQNSEQDGQYHIAVLLDPYSRGGSAEVHRALHHGTCLRIGRPRNNFRLIEPGAPAVFVAGGIGITPLLFMADAMHRQRHEPFVLHYATRSRTRAAFLDRLASAPWAGRVRVYHDNEVGQPRFDCARHLPAWDGHSHLYVCGPGGMIDATFAVAATREWPAWHLHSERFTASAQGAGEAFEVLALRSGITVTVSESQSIAGALASAGIEVPLSCEQGICGTCLTPVVEGIPDHRDQYQTDDEKAANSQIALCCSRAATKRLVLDL